MNIFEYDDASNFLKDTIEFKKKKNPNFSLRAFAKKCNMTPSLISGYINGKNEISIKSAEKIALALNFSEMEYNFFLQLISKNQTSQLDFKDDRSLKLSLQYREEIKSFLEKSKVLDSFHYTDREKLNYRRLILFADKETGKFNGSFCDSILYLLKMQVGYNYHFANNDGTYRTYATVNNQQFSPFVQGEENKSLKVSFDQDGFPTIHDAYISVPNNMDEMLATIQYSKSKAEVSGTQRSKGLNTTARVFVKEYLII